MGYTLTEAGYDFMEDTLSFFISDVDDECISEHFADAALSYCEGGDAVFGVTNILVDQQEYFILIEGVHFIATPIDVGGDA